MGLCYANPPFTQLAKVLTKIALKGARVVLCTPVCIFLELGQFGSPNSKGVSKGCAWGLFGGNIVYKSSAQCACSAKIPPCTEEGSVDCSFR